jgi:hypothetical protein
LSHGCVSSTRSGTSGPLWAPHDDIGILERASEAGCDAIVLRARQRVDLEDPR